MEHTESIRFPFDPDKRELRMYFNTAFPSLEIDPVQLLSGVHPATGASLERILQHADIDEGVLGRVHESIEGEFQAYLTMTGNHSEPALVIDQESRKRTAVIPAGFLARVSEDIQHAQAAGDIQASKYRNGTMAKPLHYGARLCLMYSYGLLVFEEIDPWHTLTAYADRSDAVQCSIAASLLCTGLSKPQDLQMNILTGYMRTILPGKFAATLALKDLEYALVEMDNSDEAESSQVVRRFVAARKAACVATRASRAFALSQADQAFESPLSYQDLNSFVRYASELAEELHGDHEVTHATFPKN